MNTGTDVDPNQLASGAGLAHGELLVEFVEASYGDLDTLAQVRQRCVEALGYETMVDAAAVIANFHMMTRIADGTGTPLDDGSAKMSDDLRDAIGVNDFESKRFDPTAA